MAPFVIQSLMDKPAFREWITRPPAGELETLQQVPYADRVRISDGLNQVIDQAAKSGKPFQVSPAVAAFLAANTRPVGPKTQQIKKTADEYRSNAQ